MYWSTSPAPADPERVCSTLWLRCDDTRGDRRAPERAGARRSALAPANGMLSSVSVGADHIDVSYEVAEGTLPDGAPASYRLVDLLGTPKAS